MCHCIPGINSCFCVSAHPLFWTQAAGRPLTSSDVMHTSTPPLVLVKAGCQGQADPHTSGLWSTTTKRQNRWWPGEGWGAADLIRHWLVADYVPGKTLQGVWWCIAGEQARAESEDSPQALEERWMKQSHLCRSVGMEDPFRLWLWLATLSDCPHGLSGEILDSEGRGHPAQHIAWQYSQPNRSPV